MNERDFCYWLQGYMEISGNKELTAEQLKIVQDHLNLVFQKVTPVHAPPFTITWPQTINPGLGSGGGIVQGSTLNPNMGSAIGGVTRK